MSLWTTIAGALFGGGKSSGGGGVIGKGIDLISERTEDADKRNAAIVDLIRMQIEAEKNPVWMTALQHWPGLTFGARAAICTIIFSDAIHKLARVLLWLAVVYLYVDLSKASGQPVDLQTLAMMAAGPGLYTFLKGRGR